jgi:hypothetical protein
VLSQNAATLKQCEALIEKLCLRFNTTSSVRQWRDIAFCLSQLHFTEKGFRKLLEKEIVDVCTVLGMNGEACRVC